MVRLTFFIFLWGILSVVFDFRKRFGEIDHITVMNVVGFCYTKITNRYRICVDVFVGR